MHSINVCQMAAISPISLTFIEFCSNRIIKPDANIRINIRLELVRFFNVLLFSGYPRGREAGSDQRDQWVVG